MPLLKPREINAPCFYKELFSRIGENAQTVPQFYCDYGSNIFAGRNFYMNYGCIILDCNTVHIGDDAWCAPYAPIYTAHHPINPNERANIDAVGNPRRAVRSV